jgi:hypothetical protein
MRCRSSLVMGQFIPTIGNPSVAPLFLFEMAPSRYIADGMYGFSCRRDNGFPVEATNLDERIRDLCAKAISVASEGDFHEALTELQRALHEHNDRLRKLVSGAGRAAK